MDSEQGSQPVQGRKTWSNSGENATFNHLIMEKLYNLHGLLWSYAQEAMWIIKLHVNII